MLVRVFALALLVWLTACSSGSQILTLNSGEVVPPESINQNPISVLPTGALVVSSLDAQALFRSPYASEIGRLVQNLLPVGMESRFRPERDLKRVHAAFYAMQGADFCAVLQGQFDAVALRQAAQSGARTPSGKPLGLRRYGPFEVFQVGDIGFVPLTPQTIVSGNSTGLRRALDRLRFGKQGTELQPWMVELLSASQQAPSADPPRAAARPRPAFVVVGDVGGQAVLAATGERLPFVRGLRFIRVLGNFQPPGMNLVGSVTYGDAEQAKQGAAAMGQLQQLSYLMAILAAFGIGGQLPAMDVQVQGQDVAFAAPIDAGLVRLLLAFAVSATQAH